MTRTALWQAIKKAWPNLTDREVDAVLVESAERERRLILDGTPADAAREIVRQEMFPTDEIDPFAGDEKYGPTR